MHEKGESPIEIGRLQRYAVDHVLETNIQLFQRRRAKWQARGLHRLRAGFARLRGGTREVGLRSHDFRPQRTSRRPEYLRHRRV